MAIADVNQAQQAHDRSADRHYVPQTGGAKREKYCLGPLRGHMRQS